MSWFLLDRKPRPGGDRFLTLKIGLFVAGALAAVLGMALHRDWLVSVALILLAAGLMLRFLPRARPPAP